MDLNEEIIEEEDEEEEEEEEEEEDNEEGDNEEEEDFEEEDQNEYKAIKNNKLNVFDFIDYIDNSPFPDCGKVICHKTINTEIHYLFQDNQDPPNMLWIPGSSDLSRDQVKAIQNYWLMFRYNDKCGLPKRPQKQIKIKNIIALHTEKDSNKYAYEVKTPNLPIEFFTMNDFKYGLEGRNPLSKPVRYFEERIFHLKRRRTKKNK